MTARTWKVTETDLYSMSLIEKGLPWASSTENSVFPSVLNFTGSDSSVYIHIEGCTQPLLDAVSDKDDLVNVAHRPCWCCPCCFSYFLAWRLNTSHTESHATTFSGHWLLLMLSSLVANS